MFIHKNKLFKLLVSYSIAAMGLNLFFVLAGNIHFDCNVLLFTSLLWGLEAAETAVVLFLFIVTANCLAIINIKLLNYDYLITIVQLYDVLIYFTTSFALVVPKVVVSVLNWSIVTSHYWYKLLNIFYCYY